VRVTSRLRHKPYVMNAAWADLLEALESPSSTSTPSPTSPPHGSLLTPLVAYSDADSHHLELVVRDAQRKRRLNAQAQDVGKAFEDAICAYFFPFPPARNTSAQTHRPVAGPGLTRSKSSASSTPAPRARGKSQWPFPTSPLTPTSSQIWLDSARRLGELDRTVDLMLEDNSRERGLAAFTRPQLSKEVRPLVAKRTCCHIGWFPSEILVQIFLQLSEHSSSVLSITHVNCRWRESALDIPSLFTSTALWDKWSPPLLEEWNARTKGKPLSVKFSNDALLRMHNEDDFYSLVQSSHHVWEELDIAVATFGQSGHTLDACTSILHLEMPLLRRLRLVGSNDIGLSSTALDVPSRLIDSLTHLRLSNAVIIVTVHDATETTESAPHLPRSVAIDDVFVSNERWIEFWRACHGFGTVKVARCGVTERQVTSEPGLQDLPTMIRMVFSDSTDVLGLPMILSCRFSNLRHLTIKGGPALTKDMWIELVSIRLISSSPDDYDPRHMCTDPLCSKVEHNQHIPP